MHIKGIIFDVNGTLVDIKTDEHYSKIYRFISRYLTFQGIHIHHETLRNEYFEIIRQQRHASPEHHPEYDVEAVWRELLRRRVGDGFEWRSAEFQQMPVFLAQMYRGISRRRLQPYPGVHETLEWLRQDRRLAVLTDAQRPWAVPELRAVGLAHFFDPVVVSGDHGFRKPDERLFRMTLERMGLAPWEVLHVGNDIYRDVHGPKRLGMKTVFHASNQGRGHMDGVEPDYVIHDFRQLGQAVEFFERTH